MHTCHLRGAHAMGGMAAQIPIKDDPEANEKALDKVRADKLREVREGHDGTWVAHPALVSVAKQVFDARTPWSSRPRAPGPKRVFASTFASRSGTSKPGSTAKAPCPSTT